MTAASIDVVPARAVHVRTLARRMRRADRDEVAAASGLSPAAALVTSLRRSAQAWTGRVDGRPVVMFGVADVNVLTGVGAIWLLGTDEVERHVVPFLRWSRQWSRQLSARYEVLANLVDDRNEVSKRWLVWLGAEFGPSVDVNGHRFRPFRLRGGGGDV